MDANALASTHTRDATRVDGIHACFHLHVSTVGELARFSQFTRELGV